MTKLEWVGKYKNFKHWITSVWEVVKAGYPALGMTVIGVTGTDGKTTTSHLIYEMLKAGGHKVALISTVAAYIGDEEIDTGFHVTTPDAKLLQPLIRKIRNMGIRKLVLEVTSHGLDQHRVLGCHFYIGVITNITHEHLDYHKTFETYRETKAKLIAGTGYAVLNKDEPNFEWLKKHVRGMVIPYGKYAEKVDNPTLVGEYNLYNIGAAEAVVRLEHVEQSVIDRTVKNFSGIPGRMEEVKLGQKFRAIVDFAHTPNAQEVVLTQLRKELPMGGRLIVVFGCAGLRDHTKRPLMGEVSVRLADIVVITAEDPRTETLDNIYEQIMVGARKSQATIPKHQIIREDDRQEAINKAVGMTKPGDIVVTLGKGHEKSMCFGTTEYPWSDKEAVKKAVAMYT